MCVKLLLKFTTTDMYIPTKYGNINTIQANEDIFGSYSQLADISKRKVVSISTIFTIKM